jgi:hypothetical protein
VRKNQVECAWRIQIEQQCSPLIYKTHIKWAKETVALHSFYMNLTSLSACISTSALFYYSAAPITHYRLWGIIFRTAENRVLFLIFYFTFIKISLCHCIYTCTITTSVDHLLYNLNFGSRNIFALRNHRVFIISINSPHL